MKTFTIPAVALALASFAIAAPQANTKKPPVTPQASISHNDTSEKSSKKKPAKPKKHKKDNKETQSAVK